MGRVIRQTRDRTFSTLRQSFQTLDQGFDFLFKLQKLGRVFTEIGHVFYDKYAAECFAKENIRSVKSTIVI